MDTVDQMEERQLDVETEQSCGGAESGKEMEQPAAAAAAAETPAGCEADDGLSLDGMLEEMTSSPCCGTGYTVDTGNTSTTVTSTATDLQTGIDNLLDRHRNEIARELSELEETFRPVSADGTRRAAVTALINRFVRPATATRPAEATQQRRPEQVIVEVNALVERRPVTSMLQSSVFRTSIENSLRQAVHSLQRSNNATIARQRQLAAHTSSQSISGDSSVDSVAGAAAVTSSSSRSSGNVEGLAAVSGVDVPVTPRLDRAQAWLRQIPDQPDQLLPPPPMMQQQQQRLDTAEVLEEMQHENFITEISELIHQQLVTTALQGTVRDRLERMMANRLQLNSTNGPNVLQFIRQLPRSARQRNDFSDLGIAVGQQQQQDQLDDISVISATAAVTLPHAYTQSTAALSREIGALRSQMMELKNLLQLSFDLQLDTQRAIKQEVAAAVSTAIADVDRGAASGAVAASGRGNQPVGDSGNCLICLDKTVDTVLYQCGHMCLCYTCAMQLRQRGAHCPVCRAPIRDIIRAYRSG